MKVARRSPRFEVRVVAVVLNVDDHRFYVAKPAGQPARSRWRLPAAVLPHGDTVKSTLRRCLQEAGFAPVEFSGRQLPFAVLETVETASDVHAVTLCYLLKLRNAADRNLPAAVRAVSLDESKLAGLTPADRDILARVAHFVR